MTKFMGRWCACALLCAALFNSGCSLPGAAEPPGKVVRIEMDFVASPPADMAEAADVVLLGTVSRRLGTFTAEDPPASAHRPGDVATWVLTEWSVIPEKVYKGDITAGQPVTVVLRGGSAERFRAVFSGEVRFRAGEKVLIFLTRNTGGVGAGPGRYFIYAGQAGKYSIEPESVVAKSALSDRSMPLADLEREIQPARGTSK